VLLATLLLPAAIFLRAQAPAAERAKSEAAATSAVEQAASTPSLNVDARLVDIPVVVYDKKRTLVQTLTQDSFVLQVDGHNQPIRYFNRDTELPLTLGLLIDVSQSQRDAIDDERTASFAFLDQMLNGPASGGKPGNSKPDRDKAFIVQFARQTDLLQDTTPSKPKLQAALKQLDIAPAESSNSSVTPVDSGNRSGNNENDNGSGNNGNRRDGSYNRPRRAGTTLYDALFLSSDELMSKQSGRKALFILSDGVDSGSKESLASAIEAAQRANTIVYAIYFKGRENISNREGFPGTGQGDRQGGGGQRGGIGFPGGGGYPGSSGGGRGTERQPENLPSQIDGRKILTRITEETGGRLFEVDKKQTFSEIYAQIADELRSEYRLGYTPDKDTASDGYHRIIVTLAKGNPKDFYIQTRDGYYAGN
jgi:VWFA-related protein